VDSFGVPYAQPTLTYNRTGVSAAGNQFSVQISAINTPTLLQLASGHYQCANLSGIGVELEDSGDLGTAGSHWENRIVGNEYMSGYANKLMPVSYLTLSLFADMGWYQVNFSNAEYWGWGKDQGCSWLTGRCENTWNSPGYFCGTYETFGCSADRLGYGNCYVTLSSSLLPAYYQHFTNTKKGGYPPADYCTFISPSMYCTNASEIGDASVFEIFGASSLCYEYTSESDILAPIPSAACYPSKCELGTLQLYVNQTWIICPLNGGLVNVSDLQDGVLNCPRTSQICREYNQPAITTFYPSGAVTTMQSLTTLFGSVTSTGINGGDGDGGDSQSQSDDQNESTVSDANSTKIGIILTLIFMILLI